MMPSKRTFFLEQRGAAAAEMVLLLPFLLVLLFVTFEGANFMWNEHTVVKSARNGARYAARLPFSSYATCPAATGAAASVAEPMLTQIKEITRTGQLSQGTPKIAGWQNIHVTVTCDHVANMGGVYSTNEGKAPRITVSVAVPYPSSPITDIAKVLGFDASGITLRASAQSSAMGL